MTRTIIMASRVNQFALTHDGSLLISHHDEHGDEHEIEVRFADDSLAFDLIETVACARKTLQAATEYRMAADLEGVIR